MPLPTTLADFQFADMTVRYVRDEAGRVGLTMFPTATAAQIVPHRESLAGQPEIDSMTDGTQVPAVALDPLVHLKIVGDAQSNGFAQGRTMRNSPSTDALRLSEQRVDREGDATTVVTTLKHPHGLTVEHRLTWREGDSFITVITHVRNDGPRPIGLEMLTSFSLGGITPFHRADAPERLVAHRFRSVWSGEGRHVAETIEQLHLERSWLSFPNFSERFGQVGSMPVRGWFPFAAVEDRQASVFWGAQLAWAGSWQIELARRDDWLCLSGGLADREFGHWVKTLSVGETLETPPATLTCVQGGFEELCHRLTLAQQRAADAQPTVEADLPIVFNEWCTTWGDPTHANLTAIADRLKGTEIKYLVIDAGWYKPDGGNWGIAQGDWIPNKGMFPDGLAATAAAIRERGLVPGLWFEAEVVGPTAAAFSLVDHLLKRDGIAIEANTRRFWNLNDPFVVDHLANRVIGLLRACNFGYIKIDYNDNLGIGVDGAESLGEGLRKQTLGTYRFFERMREELPELVIENCSSGAHRLEPSMIGRSAMSSFSDAHETREIPLIAANLHKLVLPRQSQIWAVLRETDSTRRLVYSLAATFLGRMCLSGSVTKLSPAQWELTLAAQRLYRRVWPIIKHGRSYRHGDLGPSFRHPRGWQAVLRVRDDGKEALAVMHTFAQPLPVECSLPLPAGSWRIAEELRADGDAAVVRGAALAWKPLGEFAGRVVHLVRGQ